MFLCGRFINFVPHLVLLNVLRYNCGKCFLLETINQLINQHLLAVAVKIGHFSCKFLSSNFCESRMLPVFFVTVLLNLQAENKMNNYVVYLLASDRHKQPSRGVLRKSCSENLQQIYRRTPMPKYDFTLRNFTLKSHFDISVPL